MQVEINYKSGKTRIADINNTAEEIAEKLKSDAIEINPKTLSMIRWSEVESMSEVIK